MIVDPHSIPAHDPRFVEWNFRQPNRWKGTVSARTDMPRLLFFGREHAGFGNTHREDMAQTSEHVRREINAEALAATLLQRRNREEEEVVEHPSEPVWHADPDDPGSRRQLWRPRWAHQAAYRSMGRPNADAPFQDWHVDLSETPVQVPEDPDIEIVDRDEDPERQPRAMDIEVEEEEPGFVTYRWGHHERQWPPSSRAELVQQAIAEAEAESMNPPGYAVNWRPKYAELRKRYMGNA